MHSSAMATRCSAPTHQRARRRGDGHTWSYLDLTALGRQETWEVSPEGYPQTAPYKWWNWNDNYGTPSRRPTRSGSRCPTLEKQPCTRVDKKSAPRVRAGRVRTAQVRPRRSVASLEARVHDRRAPILAAPALNQYFHAIIDCTRFRASRTDHDSDSNRCNHPEKI